MEYGIKISMERSNSWCFFGGKVLHGTSRSKNLDKLHLIKSDIYFSEKNKLSLDVISKYVNISWGQYTRAPREVIYNRNVSRIRLHDLAVATSDRRGRRLTQTRLARARRGRDNYLVWERDNRNRNRNRNQSSSGGGST